MRVVGRHRQPPAAHVWTGSPVDDGAFLRMKKRRVRSNCGLLRIKQRGTGCQNAKQHIMYCVQLTSRSRGPSNGVIKGLMSTDPFIVKGLMRINGAKRFA